MFMTDIGADLDQCSILFYSMFLASYNAEYKIVHSKILQHEYEYIGQYTILQPRNHIVLEIMYNHIVLEVCI